ncbi:hypothetical protein V6N12_049082 [Hibiscus sabdariffa]|uniref:Uncharacterized protein n=1 Tax=Hibiscus sabdariffa TaxID=183260 RepID=A0ABR2EJ58_9ROSI
MHVSGIPWRQRSQLMSTFEVAGCQLHNSKPQLEPPPAKKVLEALRIYVLRHVRFDETVFPFATSYTVPAKSLSQLNKLSGVYESDSVPIVSGKQADHSGSIESDQVGAEQVDSGAIQQITDQECPVQSMSAPTTSAQVECGSADCTQEEWSTDCEQTDYGQASNGRVVFGCHEQLCQGTRMNGDEVNLAEGTA